MQAGRLKIAEMIPDARVLVEELLAYRVKITANAHDVHEPSREGAHDDLLLAVALACWYGETYVAPAATTVRRHPARRGHGVLRMLLALSGRRRGAVREPLEEMSSPRISSWVMGVISTIIAVDARRIHQALRTYIDPATDLVLQVSVGAHFSATGFVAGTVRS